MYAGGGDANTRQDAPSWCGDDLPSPWLTQSKRKKEKSRCRLEYLEREGWECGWRQCSPIPAMNWSLAHVMCRERNESLRDYGGQISRRAAMKRPQTLRSCFRRCSFAMACL